jgi:amino acid transporter, AAT family
VLKENLVLWSDWFNDAISVRTLISSGEVLGLTVWQVASDLTAAQLLLNYWTPWHPWVISLLFLVFILSINSIHVRAYGELGGSFNEASLLFSSQYNTMFF